MQKFKRSLTVLIALFVFTTGFLAGSDERIEKVDKLFEKFNSVHTPGASLAIIQDGKIIYKQAYGMASLELGVPNTTQTVFRLGSVSKQFTAACIAMLAMEGKLNLDASIAKFFPALPEKVYGPVKIKHMIHHTSGIRDSEALYPVMNMEYSQWYTHDMLLDMLARQKSLDFKPGEKMEYSNSAYTLLALLVQKVAGKPFHEFAQEHIFHPLGMNNTRIQTSHNTFIPNRAAGYAPSQDGYINWMTNNQLIGHDAVYSSVEDMYYWIQAFFDGTLGKDLMKIMTTRSTFNNGSTNNYAYGIVVDNYKGLRTYTHSGWYVGYLAFIVIFPENNFSVVCLSNVAEGSPAKACFNIAEIYLEDQLKESLRELRSIKKTVDNKITERLAGDYVGIDYGGQISLTAEGGELKPKGADWSFEPSPFADNEFINYDRRTRLRILSGFEGEKEVIWEILNSMGSVGKYMKRKEISLVEEDLSKYTGKFGSKEVTATAQVKIEKGKLMLKVGRLSGELSAIGKDNFDAKWGILKFYRDSKGKIKSFGLSKYGFQNVHFEKIEPIILETY